MAYASGLGLTSTALSGALWAKVSDDKAVEITKEMLHQAERLAGLEFTEDERELMVEGLNRYLEKYRKLREVPLNNSVAPAVQFNPVLPGMTFEKKAGRLRMSKAQRRKVPSDLEDLAFWPVTDLARVIKSRKVSSVELANMYLDRLKRYDAKLKCVVTLTEELALKQAGRADEEIAAGHYLGPLHGIPWGAKDLLAVRGYRTTWGAMPYRDQVIDYDATVVKRLEEAGAVLVGKLTLGALAWGDVWFGGKTRNPWDPEKGSSGSSAGPASATVAGLVGFSIGSETHGSIVSPCTVCGTTGLRPTFGRVSRHGAMALSWSMDKIGPICRTVEDCAIVLHAINGPDGKDATLVDVPFNWDASLDVKGLKVGYLKSTFDEKRSDEQWKANDRATLDVLRGLGLELTPIELPDYPIDTMGLILNVEAAAAFDELTHSGRDKMLVRQIKNAWPNRFREARTVPAVEYIQANRLRTLVMSAMQEKLAGIDAYVCPSWVGKNLHLTNLTGHPAVVVPNGLRKEGTPSSISFVGRLFGEDKVLALAKAYQDATSFHLKHPTL
ncbi:MAG: amidase family protein [Planctomycetota bacterium]|jgi:Asp-tRNA(Asn)/Glu-tRNA(Gln) amidotransferase A subunit family amidase